MLSTFVIIIMTIISILMIDVIIIILGRIIVMTLTISDLLFTVSLCESYTRPEE